jgi:protein-disulfide isomerase
MATVGLAGNAILRNPEAPLTLIEFSDYQRPFCARFHQSTLAALKAEYIDTGKLRYVFRDFPLDHLHPQARKAAEAARCAGEQGQYWEMHDLLFQHQQALEVEQLQAYGRDLGPYTSTVEDCLAQGRHAADVQQDYENGMAAGVRGTPGFFLGKTRPDWTIQGLAIKGAQPIATFRQAIERLMAEK